MKHSNEDSVMGEEEDAFGVTSDEHEVLDGPKLACLAKTNHYIAG